MGIHDRDAAAAFDFERFVGADENRGIFIESDADRERVVRQRGDEAAQPIALPEMLIDHEPVCEPQARGQPHAAGDHRRALVAERDHVLAQNAGTGARSPDRDASGVSPPDHRGDRRAAEKRCQSQLVAAGEEDTARFLEPLQAIRLPAIAPGIEVHHRDARRPELAKQFFVAWPGLIQSARSRDDHDVRRRASRHRDETREDAAIILLILGPADRNDPAPCFAFRNFAWHGGESSAKKSFKCAAQDWRSVTHVDFAAHEQCMNIRARVEHEDIGVVPDCDRSLARESKQLRGV